MHWLQFDRKKSQGTKQGSLFVCGLGLLTMVLLLFGFAGVGGAGPPAAVQAVMAAPQVSAPALLAVSPGEAPNNLDVTLTLTGTEFQAILSGTQVLTAPVVSLDDFGLPAVGWISSTSLTTTVPWGLEAGVYTVTVTNPDGGAAWLTNAFTVEQAIGVWTTAGPYGGHVETVVVHPQINTTLMAIASEVGLFRSTDGADSWQLVRPSSTPIGTVSFKPGAPDTVLWGDGTGLFQSNDVGDTWQQIFDRSVSVAAYAPSLPERIYVVTEGQVRVRDGSGQPWTAPGTGLPGTRIFALAVHPITPTIAFVATDDHLYRTDDAATSWTEIAPGLPPGTVRRLWIDPFAPKRMYAVGRDDPIVFHRSLDGGVNWQAMTLSPEENGLSDIAFHPTISGTLYGITCRGSFSSTNAGATWSQVNHTPLDCMWAIGLDPVTGAPRYGGGGSRGVLRSWDAAYTWEVASEGMNALQLIDISASESHPEQVYAAASSAGGFASADAGSSWQLAVSGDWTNINAAQADPVQSCTGYLGGMAPGLEPNSGLGCIYKTSDCGQTWVPRHLPATYSPVGELVVTMAIDPSDPDTMFAGGIRSRIDTGVGLGMVYRTTDSGLNWAELDVGYPLSDVVAITFDPLVTDTLYLATGTRNDPGGMPYLPTGAVYKSADGGSTWHLKDSGLSGLPIVAMVIDPSDSKVLYVGVYDNPEYPEWPTDESGVFKSTDGGESWNPTNSGLDFHDITSLFIDPLETQMVYAGTRWHGLYRSTDGGTTWTRASGPFGNVGIFCLGGGETGERTFIYVCTAGGSSGDATITHASIVQSTQQILGAGVYQQTIDHRPRPTVYLPLVVRRH